MQIDSIVESLDATPLPFPGKNQSAGPCANPNGILAIAQGCRACEATLGEASEGDFNRNAVVAIDGRCPMRPGAAMWMAWPATTALRLDFTGMVFPG
jgi:hypothetical protein